MDLLLVPLDHLPCLSDSLPVGTLPPQSGGAVFPLDSGNSSNGVKFAS
jgi:hypothetical protein